MSTSGTAGDAGEVGFSVVTPSVPASTVKVTNNNPYTVRIYILTAGTTTVYTITDALGTSQAVTAALAAGQVLELGPKEAIAVTYSVAFTWKWFGVPPS